MVSSRYLLIALLVFFLAAGPIGAWAAPQNSGVSGFSFRSQRPCRTRRDTDYADARRQWFRRVTGSAAGLPTQPGCYVQASPDAAWQPTTCGTAGRHPRTHRPQDLVGGRRRVQVRQRRSREFVEHDNRQHRRFLPRHQRVDQRGGRDGAQLSGERVSVRERSSRLLLSSAQQPDYSCSTGYTDGFTVPQCWEQFVSSNTGELYIQFWLIGYCSVSGGSNCGDSPPFTASNPPPSFSCPSTGIPSGSGWMQSGGNCYANSAMVSPPRPPPQASGP